MRKTDSIFEGCSMDSLYMFSHFTRTPGLRSKVVASAIRVHFQKLVQGASSSMHHYHSSKLQAIDRLLLDSDVAAPSSVTAFQTFEDFEAIT